MPTVKQMQHFRAIYQSGTLQGAAQTVHISQPALTRSISNLEFELGLELFERSKSGMLPTDFAEQIAPRFDELLLELDDKRREAQIYRNLESGHLRIGMGQAIREPLVRNCLPHFVEQYPGVAIEVREGKAPELARALQQREIDMIIAGVASYREYEFARWEHVLNIPVRVVVRQGHPLAGRKNLSLEDLFSYPQAAPTSLGDQHPFRRRPDIGAGQQLTPHYLCSDYSALESIVKLTDAWTVTLDTELHRNPSESLVPLRIANFDITIELSVIELTRRSRSPAAHLFIEAVKAMLVL